MCSHLKAYKLNHSLSTLVLFWAFKFASGCVSGKNGDKVDRSGRERKEGELRTRIVAAAVNCSSNGLPRRAVEIESFQLPTSGWSGAGTSGDQEANLYS